MSSAEESSAKESSAEDHLKRTESMTKQYPLCAS